MVSFEIQLLLPPPANTAIRLRRRGLEGSTPRFRLGSTHRGIDGDASFASEPHPFCERTADFSYALVPAPSGPQENRMAERRRYGAAAACWQRSREGSSCRLEVRGE